jgi:1-acyl-sn-glycerol-3-phosphate acyltransferase
MFKTIIWFLFFLGSLTLKLPSLRRLKKSRKKLPPYEFAINAEKLSGDWAYNRVKQTKSRIVINGAENIPDGAVLFVANHQSMFDIGIFLGYIRKPKGFIAKIESKKVPLVTGWMEEIDCLFIDRNDMKQMAKTILEGIEILKNGHSLVVFPEGTRSADGTVGEFKAGSFKLATKSRVPIVPVTIHGTRSILEDNGNRIKAGDVWVKIHPKIETADLSRDEITELPEMVRGIIVAALPGAEAHND